MKKVLIIGAGAQGGPCASILARDGDVSEVVLGDIDLDLANRVREKIGSEKIRAVRLDASSIEDVQRAAEGAKAIINLTLTAFNSNIMKGALASGCHYVDTSFGEPVLLDIRARDNILSQIIENRPLELDGEFKKAGLTALVGCGKSPGMVNVLARYVCDRLNRVEEIRIRLCTKSLKGSREVVRPWEPTWSPFRALWGYAVEPTIFEDGEYRKHPLFDGCEEYDFPDPVGRVMISYHQHQEPITLPHFIGKGIRYCDFKYAVDPIAGALVKMGFGDPEAIEVGGVRVVPRDVLLKLVRQPVNAFLAENEEVVRRPLESASFMVTDVAGLVSGERLNYTITCPFCFPQVEERMEVYRRFGTTLIGVALPAVVGAKMCMDGEAEKGVIAAECLDAGNFLKRMARMGGPVRFHELCSRNVTVT
ncbi:MAG: saccharopine dehydrogenase NADP-binding domain-containing protein [Deltaproteobacteria bacterium]|nr:saccharopine dehydrogenase NADP-binding domain-containing protein [Deltaproteobacteria bacterium]